MINEEQHQENVHKLNSFFYVIGDIFTRNDGIVDINGSLAAHNSLQEIPVLLGRVTQDFDVSSSRLKTLKNCPSYVGGSFDCSSTHLTSLIGGPKTVLGSYRCSDTDITSLRGAPETTGTFSCVRMHQLKTLAGAPARINGNFLCFDGAQIKTLKHVPDVIDGECFINYHSTMGLLTILDKNWKICTLLGVPDEIYHIVNKYCGLDRRSAMAMAAELIAAGYVGNAHF